MTIVHSTTSGAVLVLSAYSVLKFLFFFIVPYRTRRAALDKSYAGKAYATGASDRVLLLVAALVAAVLLTSGGEPIPFLGGLFVGATLIQMFFHAFHEEPSPDRAAPAPKSPLKRLSYAIQDRPQRAGASMALYSLIAITAVILYLMG